MCAAFDGRFESGPSLNFGGRIGCIEHGLSICIKDVFEKNPCPLLATLLDQITAVESFYNRRDDKARQLNRAIPEKSATRPWRFHYSRLVSAVDNYAIFLKEDDPAVAHNLPSLALLKSLLSVMQQCKLFFDRAEVRGPTSHLSFLSYLSLDVELFKMETDTEGVPPLARTICSELRACMGTKLWGFCGSDFAQASAYFAGVDVPTRTTELLQKFSSSTSPAERRFFDSWMGTVKSYASTVTAFFANLIKRSKPADPTQLELHQPGPSSSQAHSSETAESVDTFSQLFSSSSTAKKPKIAGDVEAQLAIEQSRFDDIRYPFRDPQEFWKDVGQLPLLQTCARILLSVPVSSAAVERMFGEAGMVLTKLRKKTRPQVLQAMMYLKYGRSLENLTKDIDVEPDEVERYLDSLDKSDVESSDDE